MSKKNTDLRSLPIESSEIIMINRDNVHFIKKLKSTLYQQYFFAVNNYPQKKKLSFRFGKKSDSY